MHTIEQLQTGVLKGAKHIKISQNLTSIPIELYQFADTLEILDLSGNELTILPEQFACFTQLRILFLSNNKFDLFPSVLGLLPMLDIVGFKANQICEIPEHSLAITLRWLILTDNKIECLPQSIGQCVNLQKVMLAGNKLNALPNTMALCKNIELLRISANQLTELPAWLVTLPKLAWLAFADNAFNQENKQDSLVYVGAIDWQSIEIKELLGEGASGMIYKATLKDTNQDVAVKIFKGAVTSDGLPKAEMHACISAGMHSNLVSVIGVINAHPDGKEGLVMDLISSNYMNLGLPPNFVTCTRDTFAEETEFTIDQVVAIAHGIASAATQLHARGIMHGDLYAHNILVNELSHPLFGDFGAATIIYDQAEHVAICLEHIEVRAYGCLLDDLLSRVHLGQDTWEYHSMLELKNSCMDTELNLRPTFKHILNQLITLINKS